MELIYVQNVTGPIHMCVIEGPVHHRLPEIMNTVEQSHCQKYTSWLLSDIIITIEARFGNGIYILHTFFA